MAVCGEGGGGRDALGPGKKRWRPGAIGARTRQGRARRGRDAGSPSEARASEALALVSDFDPE
eukprot:scaffold14018_cov118-Isochrysis_galbana.AAC.3